MTNLLGLMQRRRRSCLREQQHTKNCMASKYAKAFTVPDAFPDVLRDLTREVLREYPQPTDAQPKDQEWWILDFASRYFGQRLAMSGAAADGPNMRDLEARIMAIFKEADKDNNGVLDHKEFRTVSVPAAAAPQSRCTDSCS